MPQDQFDRPTPFTGEPFQPLTGQDFSGAPGTGNPLGAAFAKFLSDPLTEYAKDAGFLPGSWTPFQNTYSQFQRRQLTKAREQVLDNQALQDFDRQNLMRTLKGMAAATRTPWDTETQAAAFDVASSVTRYAPLLTTLAPDALDAMMGPRGSAVGLADRVFSGSRYAADPVTGKMGLSADATSRLSEGIYKELYGPGADVSKMYGIGGTGAGAIYDEMQRRGLGVGLSPQRQLERMTDRKAGSIGSDEAESMLATPGMADKLRGFDATETAKRIRSMSGAVNAMKEIFGEIGRPGALPELLQALNNFTQGGLATMSPSQVEDSVRRTWTLAKAAGVGIETIQAMTQIGSAQADQSGIPRPFVTQATQGAFAFSTAFAAVGGGGFPAWGRAGREQIMLQDQALRLNTAKSTAGQQIGATMRISQMVGGFEQGSTAQQMVEAIERGDTEFAGRSLLSVRPAEWAQIIQQGTKGDISITQAMELRQQTSANQEYFFQAGGVDIVRRLQPKEIGKFVSSGFGRAIATDLREAGASPEVIARARQVAGDAAAKAFFKMAPDVMAGKTDPKTGLTDYSERNEAFARVMQQSLKDAGLPQEVLDRLDTSRLQRLSDIGLGTSSELMANDPSTRNLYRNAGGSITGVQDLFSETSLGLSRQIEKQAKTTAAVERITAPLNVYSPFRRAINALQRDEDAPVKDFLFEVAGFRDNRKEADFVAEQLKRLTQLSEAGKTEEMAPIIEALKEYGAGGSKDMKMSTETVTPTGKAVERFSDALKIVPTEEQRTELEKLFRGREDEAGGIGQQAKTLMGLRGKDLNETDEAYRKYLERGPTGKLLEGATEDGKVNVEKLLENMKKEMPVDEKKTTAGVADAGKPGELALSGTVRLIGDRIDMRGASGRGSLPTAVAEGTS